MTALTNTVALEAPAKLNLWLRLTGEKRPDGRHELESHFVPLTLADNLWVSHAHTFALDVIGPFAAGVPNGNKNLLWQAFHGFCKAFGLQNPLHIKIEKNIPHGAGLGGGSSDAGALLNYLAHTAGVQMRDVQDWASTLGADVPAAIGPHSGWVGGIGENLGQFLPLPKRRVLLVKPKQSCPTGAVFAAWQSDAVQPNADQSNAAQSKVSQNDLECAAIQICPEIKTILDYLRQRIDPDAQMTGSGSTCFALLSKEVNFERQDHQALRDYWVYITDFRASIGSSGSQKG